MTLSREFSNLVQVSKDLFCTGMFMEGHIISFEAACWCSLRMFADIICRDVKAEGIPFLWKTPTVFSLKFEAMFFKEVSDCNG